MDFGSRFRIQIHLNASFRYKLNNLYVVVFEKAVIIHKSALCLFVNKVQI